MPDIGVPVPVVINSELAKKHATRQGPVGDGMAEEQRRRRRRLQARDMDARPGDDLRTLRRLEIGPAAKDPAGDLARGAVGRQPARACSSAATPTSRSTCRRRTSPRWPKEKKLKVVGTPIENALVYIGMNVKKPPFDNVKVRQAVAYAIPYEKIMDARDVRPRQPMFGGPAPAIPTAVWPQPSPYDDRLAKAKALLAEAGYADGFETTLSFDLGFAVIDEPICVLVQESLARSASRSPSTRCPAPTGAPSCSRKTMPFIVDRVRRLAQLSRVLLLLDLPRPERDLQHDVLPEPGDGQADRRRAVRDRPEKYREDVESFIKIASRGAAHSVVPALRSTWRCRRTSSATSYWFHRQLDYRQLAKAEATAPSPGRDEGHLAIRASVRRLLCGASLPRCRASPASSSSRFC